MNRATSLVQIVIAFDDEVIAMIQEGFTAGLSDKEMAPQIKQIVEVVFGESYCGANVNWELIASNVRQTQKEIA